MGAEGGGCTDECVAVIHDHRSSPCVSCDWRCCRERRDWRTITAGNGFLFFSKGESCCLASVDGGDDESWSKSIKEDSEAWEEAKVIE